MNECDPLRIGDWEFRNKTEVANAKSTTGNSPQEKSDTETDNWDTTGFVHSGGYQLTPLDDYW